jgi:transposase
MTIPQVTLGIDVSGDFLDAFDHPGGRSRRFGNDRQGIAALIGWARRLGAFVVLEATAPCDRLLVRALETAGLGFHRANPGRARDFARSIGRLAKTDRVDARMLAAYGAAVPLRPTVPVPPERLALQGLMARRDQLVAMRKAERIRLKAAPDPFVADSIKAMIVAFDEAIEKIEQRIERTVAQSPDLAGRKAVLRSVPGIGPVAAGVLLAGLPEIGQIDRRAVAALAGLAPIARDSGTMRGRRHVRGGRKRIRDALYMAALAAVRTQPWKPIYQAMRDAGKPPKLALIAIARKLLVSLNALMRNHIAAQT